ncbi:MAG: hypothetical protein WA816_06075 [Bacteroidales bacterium]
MKISVKAIVFIVLTSIMPFCEKDKQTNDKPILIDSPIVGSWKFIDVDSCFAYVIPNPEVKRSKLYNFNGSISFFNNGKGKVTSTLPLYCDYTSFTWKIENDTLTINSKILPFNAEISIKNQDTIAFRLESCFPRCCQTIWYEILSAKIDSAR